MVANAGMIAIPDALPDQKYLMAKKQFFDQRREWNAIVAKEAREDHLMRYLAKAAAEVNEALPLLRGNYGDGCPASDAEAVLVLADWHYGMKADNIWNKYDTSVCVQRVAELREKAVRRLTLHHVKRLHIFVLGDMANGAIHVTSRVASEESVVDQLMHVSEMLAEFISVLSGYVEETNVYCTYGNHMRTVQNSKDSIHADNMERIIPWWLKERFYARSDVWVDVGNGRDSMLHANVCGHEVCAVHGDLDNDRDAGLVLSQMYERAFGKKLEYVLTGHYHHLRDAEQYGITSIQAGSLCGTDEYAQKNRLFATPSQPLLIFTPEDALDAIYHIKVV